MAQVALTDHASSLGALTAYRSVGATQGLGDPPNGKSRVIAKLQQQAVIGR